MALLGLNMMATIITMRAPGLTWSRLPIFVWSVFATSVLMVLAAPMLIATLLMAALDRTINTSFFIAGGGGSSYLFQNLFWFFGHPEVYILALPGFGIVLELLPVFTRKPLWGYRLAVSGMLGVSPAELLRLAAPPVRQRHQRRPAAVLHALHRDHLDPHRVHLPVRHGHAVEGANLLHACRCCSASAWTFNFLHRRALRRVPLGHAQRHRHARQLLRDGPLPLHDHGRADLHVLRRDLLLGSEDDRPALQRATRQGALLADVRRVQLDVHAAVRARHEGHAPARQHLRAEAAHAQRVGLDLGVRARLLDADLPRQRRLLADLRARAGASPTRGTRSRSSGRCRRRCPVNNFEQIPVFDSDPYDYGTPLPLGGGAAGRGGSAERWRLTSEEIPLGLEDPAGARRRRRSHPSRRTSARARCRSPRGCCAAPPTFFFLAFLFAYFYLRSINVRTTCGARPTSNPNQGLGAAFIVCIVLSAACRDRRGPRDEGQLARLARAGRSRASRSASRRWRCSASSTRTRTSAPPTAPSRACSAPGAAFYLIAVLATMYWLETQVATELRARRAPAHARRRHRGPRPTDRARARRRRLLLGLPRRDRRGDVRDAVPAVVLAIGGSRARVLGLVVRSARRARRSPSRSSTGSAPGARVTPSRTRVAQRWRDRLLLRRARRARASRSPRRSTRSASSCSGCT